MIEANKTVPRTPKEIKLTPADEARFWSKVNKDGPTQPHMETPCWVWTSAKTKMGYGSINIAGGMFRAHRVMWKLVKGEIPLSLFICHHCDNPSCVNPDHLFLGTHTNNMRDKISKGRDNSACGEDHGISKLDSKQVVAIRANYLAGSFTQKELAEQFGVTQPTISYIIRGKIWRHLS